MIEELVQQENVGVAFGTQLRTGPIQTHNQIPGHKNLHTERLPYLTR